MPVQKLWIVAIVKDLILKSIGLVLGAEEEFNGSLGG